MKLNFGIGNVSITEFGIGRDTDAGQEFVAVPVDVEVQAALVEMVQATWDALQKADDDSPAKYEPSEKHAATDYLYLSLADELAASIRELHQSAQLPIDAAALSDPSDVFCYFARIGDTKGRRLTALRRASQFKGILKSKNRLVRMLDDTLQIIEDTVFRLDNDFDVLVDDVKVHILRPSGFEFLGQLQQAILDAVPENIRVIRKDIAYVDFDGIEAYVAKHPRAARYLSSILSQDETSSVDKSLLRKLCKQTGVQVSESKGKLTVAEGHEMGFLEVLDRRRYEVSLIKEQPELYRAGSRKKISS
ncbi:MAG: Kiwa anti-phage protein KwaB-like domain-containing protein [Vicinamibacterales bacterium]